ncbi:MAG: MATE family efflux transporter, partial [Clostridia bacterium]
KTVSTIYSAMIIGIIPLSIIGAVCSGPLLHLMNVPNDGTFQMANTYMIVIFVGMIGTLGFNINAGIMQGFGDSKTSLLFLMIACVINIVLDLLFTVVFNMGVFGVAVATVISQIASWIFGIFHINKHYSFIHINLFKFEFDKPLFAQAMKLGIPSGIQQALFALGTMAIQGLVNSYGSSFMAGFNGANKIDTFAFMPIQSFSMAATTYTGQNVGANNMHRVHDGLKAGMILSGGTAIVMSVLTFFPADYLMQMFSRDADVIAAGVSYLKCVLPAYFILAIGLTINATLSGAGRMTVPMITSFIALLLVRIPSAYLIAHFVGKDYMFLSYGISWIAIVIISGGYYATGRWKKGRIVSE